MNLEPTIKPTLDSGFLPAALFNRRHLERREANGTFLESHATDKISQAVFAMDLTPLGADETLDIAEFVCGFVEKFKDDVHQNFADNQAVS